MNEIIKTDENKNFPKESISDLSSYFKIQTEFYFVLSKNNRFIYFS